MRAVAGVKVQVERRLLEDFFRRREAEDAREGLVAVEDLAVQRRAVHAGEIVFEEIAVTLLEGCEMLLLFSRQLVEDSTAAVVAGQRRRARAHL